MNQPEKEALQNILFALFLESPKRREALHHQVNAATPQKYPTGNTSKFSKYQTGEKQHGYKSEEAKATVYH
jgi:hypothetical protein